MIEHSGIELKLRRIDKTYRLNQLVDGLVEVQVHKGWAHNGISLLAEGVMTSTVSSDTENKTLQILKLAYSVCPPGKFNDGIVKVPFSFTLSPLPGQVLYETYRGIHVSVTYTISVICDRGVLKKALKTEVEFIVEVVTPSINPAMKIPTPRSFSVSPITLEHINKDVLLTIPDFKITGTLHKSNCLINEPFTGEFNVEVSVAAIRSVELQLVRVESVRSTDGRNTLIEEASEIMRIQIAEGNICRSGMHTQIT